MDNLLQNETPSKETQSWNADDNKNILIKKQRGVRQWGKEGEKVNLLNEMVKKTWTE